ncbi:hypothetical protein [Nesterenkonia flava]|uniref:Uncharacterized protein n=1 Tax=Nesterenkonia flava TaxID=469799 RepID=A0ABU1FVZ2_9MICC|nr:hypothetical protein [Nesterenkonia flava]MDR5712849.1 hypothetical protein [Nesterenkonia flava]
MTTESSAVRSAPVLRFAEAAALQDLATYVARARRIQEQGIRLQTVGSILAAWVPVMTPSSLVGTLPAVLGMRAIRLAEASTVDATVELSSITERIARLGPAETELPLPPSRLNAPWAAVTPPRSGWQPAGSLKNAVLKSAAEEGIAQINQAVPTSAGAAVVEQVREKVWGAPLNVDAGNETRGRVALPAGAAFGAFALGFLNGADAETQVHTQGRWARLSSRAGYILCRTSGNVQL